MPSPADYEPLELSSILCGISGEYFVAAELSRRGYIASLTLRNTRGIDILVSNRSASATVGLQVKTSQGIAKNWLLDKKAETFSAPNLFYAFVNLRDTRNRPDFYIVPSKVVASFVRKNHKRWLKIPSKSGHEHKDTSIRKFHDRDGAYFERWELLGL